MTTDKQELPELLQAIIEADRNTDGRTIEIDILYSKPLIAILHQLISTETRPAKAEDNKGKGDAFNRLTAFLVECHDPDFTPSNIYSADEIGDFQTDLLALKSLSPPAPCVDADTIAVTKDDWQRIVGVNRLIIECDGIAKDSWAHNQIKAIAEKYGVKG